MSVAGLGVSVLDAERLSRKEEEKTSNIKHRKQKKIQSMY